MPFRYTSAFSSRCYCLLLFSTSLLFWQCSHSPSAKEQKVKTVSVPKPASCGTPHSRSGALLNRSGHTNTIVSGSGSGNKATGISAGKQP